MKIVSDSLDHQLLEFTKAEQAEVDQITKTIKNLEQEKLRLIRKFARETGLIAAELKYLKATDGSLFEESRTKPGTAKAANKEQAYLCAGHHGHCPEEGCGWIRGIPNRQPYEDFGAASGSSGHKIICPICNAELEEIDLVHS